MAKINRKFYKGKFFIVFYDKTGERLLHMFDNVREILKYQGKPCTRSNVNYINILLYRSLRTETHFTMMLDNKVMRVYTIDIEEENENE